MSVLADSNAANIAAAAQGIDAATISIPPEVEAAVKKGINALFWRWYREHEGDTVTHIHFWFFQRELKVSDLHNLFGYLFGDESGEGAVAAAPVGQ
jgi:hypothetical protein